MKKYLLIIIIIIIATVFRFYQLGNIPPSLTWDEVAWGYNAYSLGLDGKDEFGRFLPYDYLESFGDFKPPMYAYLDIVPVKIFGLNEFAVRFPSAFFGILTVLTAYFLTLRIFSKSPSAKYYALFTALILAISPWHIMLSRAAFEANVATFFLILGVFLFLYGVQKNSWIFVFSAISFVLSMYTFNTSRIVAPLLVILLALGFWKTVLKSKKQIVTTIIVGLVVLLPLLPFLLSDQAKLRFKEVNIFSNISIIAGSNQLITNDNNVWWSKIIHNRRFEFSLEYLKHYFDNLKFDFLFINGDGNPKFSIQTVGQMYLWELPFFIAGILFLIKKRESHWWIIPFWLILGIIPAGTARETPHALRIETTLPTFQIIVAYGLVNLYFLLLKSSNRKIIKPLVACYLTFAIFNIFYFAENYYMHYAKEFSNEWQYGYKDAILYASKVENNYDNIYLTPELGRPYIYALFYKKYDPELFRKEALVKRDVFGFVTVEKFGKYYFDKTLIPKNNNTLYIDISKNVATNSAIQKKFYLLDGEVSLAAYTR